MGGWLFGFLAVIDRDDGPVTHAPAIRPNGPTVRVLLQFPQDQAGTNWLFGPTDLLTQD